MEYIADISYSPTNYSLPINAFCLFIDLSNTSCRPIKLRIYGEAVDKLDPCSFEHLVYLHFKVLFYYLILSSFYIRSMFTVF